MPPWTRLWCTIVPTSLAIARAFSWSGSSRSRASITSFSMPPSRKRLTVRASQGRREGTYVQVEVKAYGNVSNATVPLMGVQAVIGDTNAAYKSEWQKRSNGWRLKLPPS
jgi:hypothetical protein